MAVRALRVRLGLTLAVMLIAGCTASATGTTTTTQQTTSSQGTDPATTIPMIPNVLVGPPDGVIDVVLTGGLIVTMTEPAEAEAIALDGDRIAAIGDEAALNRDGLGGDADSRPGRTSRLSGVHRVPWPLVSTQSDR